MASFLGVFHAYTAPLLEPARAAIRSMASKNSGKPRGKVRVGIIMGSSSDWPTLAAAADMLAALKVPFESRVVSAHRTPDRMAAYAKEAEGRGIQIIIAGAGGAAHLP